MRYNNKVIILLGVLLLSLILFVLAAKGYIQTPFSISLSPFSISLKLLTVDPVEDFSCRGTGGTITSMSQVDFVDYDTLIRDDAWLVSFRNMPGAQCLSGRFDASDVTDRTDDVSALYDFSIDIKSSPQICKYNIQRTSARVKKVELKISDRAWIPSTLERIIKEAQDDAIVLGDGNQAILISGLGGWINCKSAYYCNWLTLTPPYRVYHYAETSSYNVGNILFNKLSFSTNIILNARGKEYEGTVTNDITTEGSKTVAGKQFWLGSGNEVRAEFGGLLSTGYACPSPSDQKVTSVDMGRSDWRIISDRKYDDYKNYHDAGMSTCLVNIRMGYATPEGCKNTFNNKAETALSPATFQFSEFDEEAVISGSVIEFVVDDYIYYPELLLRIKADILGITLRCGQPEITSISSECFREGYSGQVIANVKNNANNAGAFYTRLSCPSPFNVLSSPTGNFDSNEQKEMSAAITASFGEIGEETATCTFEVWDSECSENRDSARVTVCAEKKEEKECTPGTERCKPDRSEAQKCGTGGMWNVLERCSSDEACIMDLGIAKCVQCIKEDELIISNLPCCQGLVRDGDKCVKAPLPDCESCFEWTWNLMQKDYCEPVNVWELKAGQFIGIDKGPVVFEVPQKHFCPIYISIVILFVLGFIIMIIFIIKLIKGKRR